MVTDYGKSRQECLWKAYKEALKRPEIRSHEDAVRAAMNSPSPRFWISTKEAARQIARLERGQNTTYRINSCKQEIIKEVYKRYLRLKRGFLKGSSIYMITSFAVMSEAPKMYISYNRARIIISSIRNAGRSGHEKCIAP